MATLRGTAGNRRGGVDSTFTQPVLHDSVSAAFAEATIAQPALPAVASDAVRRATREAHAQRVPVCSPRYVAGAATPRRRLVKQSLSTSFRQPNRHSPARPHTVPMAQHFHPLQIARVERETADCMVVEFAVPPELREAFAYRAGQYLTCADVGDREVRRSYSLCSAPHEGAGRWPSSASTAASSRSGRTRCCARATSSTCCRRTAISPSCLTPRGHKRALAGGRGGITPVFSILKTLLETDAASQVTLVYGNRRVKDIVFKEAIEDLRDRFMTRFQLLHTLTGEVQEAPSATADLTAKVAELFGGVLDAASFDEVHICGPNDMITSCAAACEGRVWRMIAFTRSCSGCR